METEIISNAIIIKMKKYVYVNVVVRKFPDIGRSCVRHLRITLHPAKGYVLLHDVGRKQERD